MPDDTLMVSTDTLAALCGVTARRVQQLADDGVFRNEIRGTWNAMVCVPSFHAHRIAQVEAAAARKRGSAADRHINAKARAVELRTARAEGVLCETVEALAVIEEVVGTMRAGLGGLAARVTRDLALRAVIETEIDNNFDRLATLFKRRTVELQKRADSLPPVGGIDAAEPPDDHAPEADPSGDGEAV